MKQHHAQVEPNHQIIPISCRTETICDFVGVETNNQQYGQTTQTVGVE